jgi:serine/threonine protein kinase
MASRGSSYPPPTAVDGIFQPGSILPGRNSDYKITGQLGDGRSAITYNAEDIASGDASQREVVIKMPLFDPGQPFEQIIRDATDIQRKFLCEWLTMQQLKKLKCAAQVRDYGLIPFNLGWNVDVPVLFMVQRFVSGFSLHKEMPTRFGSGDDRKFTGIPNGEDYLHWAMKITRSLLLIHQRQVVHGDIHQENIIIDTDGEAVFIDFGQAILHDVSTPGVQGSRGSGIRIVPEEDGSGSIVADIYSLGGVLYYLATGEWLPAISKQHEDIDALKNMITEGVRQSNEPLYTSNPGVVDVIARCVRYHQADRIPNADGVLRELESFSANFGSLDSADTAITSSADALKAVDQKKNRLFSSIARHQIAVLRQTLENMAEGVYDLSGDHETIVSGMKEYLACLREGDHYLTISVPSFWSRLNLGTNGRYLTMNILAAQRCATIRRIFLVTPEDDNSDEVRRIFTAHLDAQERARTSKPEIQTSRPELEAGGFYTSFEPVEKNLLDELKRGGKYNYGLLLGKGDPEDHGLLVVPVYRTDGVIATVQFRSFPGLIRDFKKDFKQRLSNSSPLSQHPSVQRLE